MLQCKLVGTLIEQNHKLGEKTKDHMVDYSLYQRLVEKLIYLSHTRPGIAYVVGVVSQFKHSPYESPMEAIYKILHYLKSTPNKAFLFQKTRNVELEVDSDVD